MEIFRSNVISIWKDAGKSWLAKLPTIVQQCADQWALTNLHPAPNLSYNYVAFGFQNYKKIALKVGFDTNELQREALALTYYDGHGSVNLLQSNFKINALLLERITPGTSLKNLFPHNDHQAVSHAVTVMQKIHHAKFLKNQFPTIADWLKTLDKPYTALQSSMHISQARTLADHLLATQTQPVLLHGDLHHANILFNGQNNEWIAIDPKGVIGEPAYEVGSFIRNPSPELLEQPHIAEIMKHRILRFAELLNIDKQRLWQWSYVQAVLAACWAIEDGQINPEMALQEANILNEIKL